MLRVEKIFEALNRSESRYLLIGGLAGILYGVPRTTLDIDLAVSPREENLKKVISTLQSLGLVPETSVIEEILGMGGTSFSNDREVDVLTDVQVGSFDELYSRREIVEYEGVKIPVVSLQDHVAMLKRTGRQKDLDDLEYLKSIHKNLQGI